jgi:DNA-binding FrmR family transcriptional regulator
MSAPVAQEELPILEAVINIRNRLTALKRDRAEFIKPSDVNALYQAVVKQVTKLNDVRDDNTTYNNRVDTTLADVFSLLSLCYLTLGRTKECPAVYSQLASMRQFLSHMEESGVYNESDLAPFQRRLSELRHIVQQDAESSKHPEAMTKLLERQFNECDVIMRSLQDSLSVLSVELVPIHERLVTIRRQLVALAAKEGSHKAEIKSLAEELRKIDSKRVDGKFLGPGGIMPASQALCTSLIEECFDILQQIKAQDESKNVASSLKPIHDRLNELRAELENLVLTHRWSLRETDLYNYSMSLHEIDKMRIDGKFVDTEGNRPPGQYVLLYLLRRCYGLIYRLLSSSEPVSEELIPIANKLSTVKKCLNEVYKFGGPFTPRDLYPYQLALHQIDSMRKDGRFVGVGGYIPEGQGIVMAHLNECHELLEMLKESMDENEDDQDYDDEEESETGVAE